jgi:hypothetical protein
MADILAQQPANLWPGFAKFKAVEVGRGCSIFPPSLFLSFKRDAGAGSLRGVNVNDATMMQTHTSTRKCACLAGGAAGGGEVLRWGFYFFGQNALFESLLPFCFAIWRMKQTLRVCARRTLQIGDLGQEQAADQRDKPQPRRAVSRGGGRCTLNAVDP